MNEDSFYRQLRREAPLKAGTENETVMNEDNFFGRRLTASTLESTPDIVGEAVDKEMRDTTPLKSLEGQLTELKQQIDRLEEEVQGAQRE